MQVLNIRDSNFIVPEGAVYVGRTSKRYGLQGSKFSNPFKIGVDGNRKEVISKYTDWLDGAIHTGYITDEDLDTLIGKDLACWCSPLLCHADVLIDYVNK